MNEKLKMQGFGKYWVEKQWEHQGYKCVVIMTSMGHRCGYVGIPKTHPLYGKHYSDHCEVLVPLVDKVKEEPIGKRGVIPIFCWDGKTASPAVIFNVHGSITYSGGNNDYPVETQDTWWFGFDCAHVDDTPEKCTLEYCVGECESLAKQLREVETRPHSPATKRNN